MDKDFIKIDELFKDLKYGEEPAAAGAWHRMKDLLDEQLTGTVRVRRGWSRYLLPAFLVLLAGAGAVYYATRPTMVDKTPATALQSTEPSPISPRHPLNNSQTGIVANDSITETPSVTTENGLASTSRQMVGNMPTSLIPTLSTEQAHDKHPNPVSFPALSSETADRATAPHLSSSPIAAISIISNPTPLPLGSLLPDAISTATLPALTNLSAATAPAGKIVQPPVIAAEKIIGRYDPQTGQQMDDEPVRTPADGIDPSAMAAEFKPVRLPDGEKVFKNKNGYYYRKQNDTISRYVVTQTPVWDVRTRSLKKLRIDTVAILRLEQVKYTPVAVASMEPRAATTGKILPTNLMNQPEGALLHSRTASSTAHLVPLDNFKVKSRKLGPNAFEKLQNTTNGLASVFDGSTNWYAALILGGNASFGNPGAFGLQAGIAVFYSFAERWAVSGGINFMNKYFPGYSFADRSADYDVDRTKIPGGGWAYSGSAVTTTHSYTVNNLNALNLPLYLNYNLTDRLSIFGGANLTYFLPIQWEKENKIQYQHIQTTREDGQNPFVNTTFQLNEKEDFSSRFGLGYVGGISYDISRTMSLDTRVQQTLWNNHDAGLEALNQLFKKPSFELSFSYYFGRKERVIYILDAHARRK